MRNAIDHRDKPIKRGDAGIGKTLALNVREHDSTIDDDEGTLTLTHVELGDSIRRLHSLVVDLTNHPSSGLASRANRERPTPVTAKLRSPRTLRQNSGE